MKITIVEILTLILLCLTGLAGVLTMPDIGVLPEAWLKYVPLALIVVLALKNAIYVFLDWWDDGEVNGSYKIPKHVPKHVPMILLVGLCLLSQVSCEAMKGVDWQGAGNRAGVLVAQVALMKVDAAIAEELAKPRPDQGRLLELQFAKLEAERLLAEMQGKAVRHDVMPLPEWTVPLKTGPARELGGKEVQAVLVPVL